MSNFAYNITEIKDLKELWDFLFLIPFSSSWTFIQLQTLIILFYMDNLQFKKSDEGITNVLNSLKNIKKLEIKQVIKKMKKYQQMIQKVF